MKIAEVKELVDIETLLCWYGWDGHGSGWGGYTKILCPFHDDTNPSGSVSIDQQRFTCFTCGIKGDVIDIVMDYESLDGVKEALDWLIETFQLM